MPNDYLPIAVLLVISVGLVIIILFLANLFGPRSPSARKQAPYESGMRPIGPAWRRMPVRFYLIAVLFILFDIEVIFFLPWAVNMQALGMFGFIEMLVFIGILLVGYIWVWRRGAFEWE